MHEVLIALCFEICFLVTAIIGLEEGDLYPVLTSILSGGVVALPSVLKRNGIAFLPWWMTLIAGTILLLHTAGIALYLYDRLWWWDILTHMTASIVLALIIALVLPSMSQWLPLIKIPGRLAPIATLTCLISLGVIWEIVEFALDIALGTRMQYSLQDTVFDLTLDLLGGSAVAILVSQNINEFEDASRRIFGPLSPGL